MPLFPIPLIHATVAPLLMPDYPTRMSISAAMCLSSSCSHPTCYLQNRDEIADDIIIAISPGTPKPLCESPHSVGNIITVPSGINPRATVASIKVFFQGINASIHTRFAFAHAWLLGILPASQLNATVRGAFMPDSTPDFLPIFSSPKCMKTSIFSGFLRS